MNSSEQHQPVKIKVRITKDYCKEYVSKGANYVVKEYLNEDPNTLPKFLTRRGRHPPVRDVSTRILRCNEINCNVKLAIHRNTICRNLAWVEYQQKINTLKLVDMDDIADVVVEKCNTRRNKQAEQKIFEDTLQIKSYLPPSPPKEPEKICLPQSTQVGFLGATPNHHCSASAIS